MREEGNIIPVSIEDEMRGAYIDYSMSVIVSRALPDVRDGLKPVHRRILYGMDGLGVQHNKSYKKSARIVGEVLGKYHPHGDTAVYDTMVRMAQPWSLRYMLVDGQGNFGSVDGDNPAAMRYTEARLQRIAEEMLSDLDKNVVDFQNNFDDTLKEPSVLPARIPNLLVNGAAGIAVGMATNMAPHNLTEVVDGVKAYVDNRDITIRELMQHVKAPDFPTGGIIFGTKGVRSAFETGRGRIVVRSVTEIETLKSGKEAIIVSELPYQVNKANLISKIAALVNEKKIEGIGAIRDESDRRGMRIVFELKRDAVANVVLNSLFKYSAMQSSFSVNNVALVNGRPHLLNLKELIHHFVEHRHEVIIRRTRYELEQAEKRAHIVEGLLKALDHIDEVIALIRASADAETARMGLMERFAFSEVQARAILDMRLQRLTGLERDKLQAEYDELMQKIERFRQILADEGLRMEILKEELDEVRERYGDERRTQITEDADDINVEDMIANEEVVLTISNQGYIKRTLLSEYRTQGRGGTGSRGAGSKEDDFTEQLFVATTHDYILVFTDKGRVYWLRAFQVPEGNKTSKGRPIQNLISIEQEERAVMAMKVSNLNDPDYVQNNFLLFATERGLVKKTALEAYSRPRQNGINALNINEGDALLDVKLTDGSAEVVLGVRSGRAIRFNEELIRATGRNSAGVRGVALADEDDRVVGVATIQREGAKLLTIAENGYGKRSPIDEYRMTNRGGKGVRAMNVTEKTGKLVALKEVVDGDELMIINRSGITIRMEVSQISETSRATQGVRLIRLNDEDTISSVARIIPQLDDEEESQESTKGNAETASEE